MCEDFWATMPANAPSKRKAQKIVFALLLLLICIVAAYSVYEQNRPWVIPEEFKRLTNPLPPSDSNLKAARDLYRDECAQCHGDRGKGDGPESKMHSPAPADLTDAGRMSGVTDGEIFYQITMGRRPMPSFKSRTTEDQRWQLTLLVRSFSQKAVLPAKKFDDVGEKPPFD
jgi:mono/diheme cytochrome c family protein